MAVESIRGQVDPEVQKWLLAGGDTATQLEADAAALMANVRALRRQARVIRAAAGLPSPKRGNRA